MIFFYRYYIITHTHTALYNPLKKEHVGKININRKISMYAAATHRWYFVRVFAVKSVIFFHHD